MNHFKGSSSCSKTSKDDVPARQDRVGIDQVKALFLGSVEGKDVETSEDIGKVEENRYEIEVQAKNGAVKFKMDTGADVSCWNRTSEVIRCRQERLENEWKDLDRTR